MRSLLKEWVVRLTRPKLIKAASEGNVAEIRRLLAAGVEVDASDGYGRTSLMEACRSGHNEAVQLLLELGADPHRVSFSDKDAFQYAFTREVLETLSSRQRLEETNGHISDLPSASGELSETGQVGRCRGPKTGPQQQSVNRSSNFLKKASSYTSCNVVQGTSLKQRSGFAI